jgi:diaminopimelate decarboxylase
LSCATEPTIATTDAFEVIAPALRAVATRFGTPAYLTDLTALDRAATAVRDAFPDPWIRQYSVKANDVPAIVAEVTARGFGANVVSRGEWAVARRAGVSNDRISLEGVGKTDADLGAAIRSTAPGAVPLAWVALESADEGEALVAMARRAGLGRRGRPALDVLVRLNPDVTPETIAGLAVGDGASKFGMTETEATGLVEWLATNAQGAVRPRGVHLHVGSQLRAVDAWRDAVRRGLAVVGLLRGNLDTFDTLDVGGGFPILPLDEPVPEPERFARELPELIDAVPADRRPARLAIEPGRALVARSGWLVARVLHVRERGVRQVVIDAGMTELIRPALYGARHPIVALTSLGRPLEPGAWEDPEPTRVEGPICESTDALGTHELPPLRRGDLVAISDTGAYAASLASTYNGRPRAAQVFLEPDGSLRLARRAGS